MQNKKEVRSFNSYLVSLAIIIGVVALGVFTLNQIIEYRYKMVLLQAPCNVCKDLNKNQSKCIDKCFTIERQLYPGLNGEWKDQSGKCFDLAGKEIECKNKINISLVIVP